MLTGKGISHATPVPVITCHPVITWHHPPGTIRIT